MYEIISYVYFSINSVSAGEGIKKRPSQTEETARKDSQHKEQSVSAWKIYERHHAKILSARFHTQVGHKPACTATEFGQRFEILDLGSRGIIGLFYICRGNRGNDQLHGYCAVDLRL